MAGRPTSWNTRLRLLDQMEEGHGLPAAALAIGLDRRTAYVNHRDRDPFFPKNVRRRFKYILPLYHAGLSLTEIAALLQLTHSCVLAHINPRVPVKHSVHSTPRPVFGSWFLKTN